MAPGRSVFAFFHCYGGVGDIPCEVPDVEVRVKLSHYRVWICETRLKKQQPRDESWDLMLGNGQKGMSPKFTYQPVLLVSFFSFSGELWGAGGGESKDSRFSDGSCISFGGELPAEEKVARSLWTSFGTSTVMRALLIALRLKIFPKLPIMLPSQYLPFRIGRRVVR